MDANNYIKFPPRIRFPISNYRFKYLFIPRNISPTVFYSIRLDFYFTKAKCMHILGTLSVSVSIDFFFSSPSLISILFCWLSLILTSLPLLLSNIYLLYTATNVDFISKWIYFSIILIFNFLPLSCSLVPKFLNLCFKKVIFSSKKPIYAPWEYIFSGGFLCLFLPSIIPILFYLQLYFYWLCAVSFNY